MTEQTQPTDAELEALAVEHEAFGFGRADKQGLSTHGFDPDGLRDFARAVLAKWGTPAPAEVEPVQWQKRHQLRTGGEWENTKEHDAKWWRDNSQGWEIRALYTTQQPTQAQAGAVPPTVEPLNEKLVAGWLARHGLTLTKTNTGYEVLKLGQVQAHGIKGADHGVADMKGGGEC